MFEPTVADGVLRVRHVGSRWLSTGWDGGLVRADAAYNMSVPEGWDRTDVDTYIDERRRQAGFDDPGPTLLTGVGLEHVRGARSEPVVAFVTVGLSNPAALPMVPTDDPEPTEPDGGPGPGTVNLILGTSRDLDGGALATLLAVAVEARAATLLSATGFPGTTTDATIVGCDPAGEPAPFAGSGTAVGAAARACVRAAVQASLRSRYPDGEVPTAVEDAAYGTTTTRRAEVFRPSVAR